MADSAASTQSLTPRAGASKRRTNTVSTDTENKLARAARSAQRLAQLSDASRDDSTLDMFPDDPTRATLEAMNIDIRQGTLHGFELPDVVLAAVGAAPETASSSSPDAKAARRATREKADAVPVAPSLAGMERVEPVIKSTVFDSAPAGDVAGSEEIKLEMAGELQASHAAVTVPNTPAMAAATVARSVTALRQTAEPLAGTPANGKADALASQRSAAAPAKTVTASGEATAEMSDTSAKTAGSAPAEVGVAEVSSSLQGQGTLPLPEANAGVSVGSNGKTNVTPGVASAPLQDKARTTPELDRARATAFADTVDALYGVISDQRRAATDHSRRMKWMLSIVVAALLVTVAIGITQTLLLMRLTRETTAQQHRVEQMMQNQQVAMMSLLDAHLAMANAPAATPVVPPAPVAPPAPQPRPAAAVASASKHAVKAHAHTHKPKAAAVR